MSKLVIFDTEYLSCEGAMHRLWSAADDPDPLLVQIGAVLIDLDAPARVEDSLNVLVLPNDRFGAQCALDPYFVALTGITNERLRAEGVGIEAALEALDRFSRGSRLWSWGKDELFALGVSCFVQGVQPSIPASRFGNLKSVFQKASMSVHDIANTNSANLSTFFGVETGLLRDHDALDDAFSLSAAVLHQLDSAKINRADLFNGA
ncbi:MAG: exonuclease [Shimia sp.]|uniref:exonuclease n=1 Tax=Shimia sp. TaxID=1954381 RepID=UPI003B8ADD87